MKLLSSLLKKIGSKDNKLINESTVQLFKNDLELATCVLLLEVSKSDDSFDQTEKDKILKILEANFRLTEKQVSFLFKLADSKSDDMISLHEWTSKINEICSYDDKTKLMVNLWDVAYADGRIDKYEDYTIRKISELLYVKHKDFIKAKLR